MPMTAFESAGGALGPPPPAKRPFALSLIFLPVLLIVAPAVNSNGCMQHKKDQQISDSCHDIVYSSDTHMIARCSEVLYKGMQHAP